MFEEKPDLALAQIGRVDKVSLAFDALERERERGRSVGGALFFFNFKIEELS